MDALNIHLPPVIPDSYYDIPNHSNSAYQTSYSTPSWTPRDEPSRSFHNQAAEFDAQPRCRGNIETRECAVGHMEVVEADPDDVIADVTENGKLSNIVLNIIGCVCYDIHASNMVFV